jgi:hypothetical protein
MCLATLHKEAAAFRPNAQAANHSTIGRLRRVELTIAPTAPALRDEKLMAAGDEQPSERPSPTRIDRAIDMEEQHLDRMIYALLFGFAPPLIYPFVLWALAGFRKPIRILDVRGMYPSILNRVCEAPSPAA